MGGSGDVTMTGGAQVGDLNRRREGKPCQAQDTILSILKQTMRHKTGRQLLNLAWIGPGLDYPNKLFLSNSYDILKFIPT